MSRLIVLSNRVKMPDNNPMAGGLAVALSDVLTEHSGIWMGWNGQIIDDTSDSDQASRFSANRFVVDQAAAVTQANHSDQAANPVTYRTMTSALTQQQYRHYYCGFANSVLWSLLHGQAHLIHQTGQDYAQYQAVNQLFAQQLNKITQPDDVIWVHDYHFLSVAYYCRQLGMRNRIGFFLHIPFAALPLWQQLDKSAELIAHLAHYDVVGTQTQQDKANCVRVCQHYLQAHLLAAPPICYLTDAKLTSAKLPLQPLNPPSQKSPSQKSPSQKSPSQAQQLWLRLALTANPIHRVTIAAYPIGVNVRKIQQQVCPLSRHYTQHTPQPDSLKPAAQRIIAVDRIDYAKGLLERFAAYHTFLQQNPAYQQQLKFLQIACPSRLDLKVYRQLYHRVHRTVHALNNQFSPKKVAGTVVNTAFNTMANAAFNDTPWQAITYSENVLNHATLMQLFWHSDIGWVNSLKDGMNLVAKEYIAAQNPANPGVLVLSRYAGASEQMQAAVIIDPNDSVSIIQGLQTALTMPLVERKRRYQALLQGLQQDDLQAWQQRFLADLHASQ